jgi:hypothetical protein
MALRRLITVATLLGFGLHLASCGGFVADHWPHWAGGMPADVPPRPGAPGYAEFIAHGQPTPEPKQEPTAAVQGAVQPNAVTPTPVRAATPDSDVPPDSSVVNGGLY